MFQPPVCCQIRFKRGAFTLIEILVVISIIALLAAMLFPAFSTAREKGRAAACQSNLHQLGQAIAMYMQDYDHYPYGVDPADKYTPGIWNGHPNVNPTELGAMPLLPEVLNPYVKSSATWKCPSDIGFKSVDITGVALDAGSNCFERYGMSYLYRTEVSILQLSDDTLYKPVETNILADAAGTWHGQQGDYRRYNVLFGDGHVKSLNGPAYDNAWTLPLQPPTS